MISVLTNDTDPEGDSLTVTSKTNGAKAPSPARTPSAPTRCDRDVGADSFTYTISDGRGGTDTATVQMTVNAVAVTPTQLSISIVDTTLVWPQQATINGTVTGANQTPVPNRQVALWARPSGGSWGQAARRRRTRAAS